jgi:hypothetical protein
MLRDHPEVIKGIANDNDLAGIVTGQTYIEAMLTMLIERVEERNGLSRTKNLDGINVSGRLQRRMVFRQESTLCRNGMPIRLRNDRCRSDRRDGEANSAGPWSHQNIHIFLSDFKMLLFKPDNHRLFREDQRINRL